MSESKANHYLYKQTDLSLEINTEEKNKSSSLRLCNYEVPYIGYSMIFCNAKIGGGALPCFFRCCIILSIWSGSMINATICITEPHLRLVVIQILINSRN